MTLPLLSLSTSALTRRFSTFSGYITRLRGYYGEAHGEEAHSYYYYTKKKYAMKLDTVPSDPFYTREWPTAWKGIDEGV